MAETHRKAGRKERGTGKWYVKECRLEISMSTSRRLQIETVQPRTLNCEHICWFTGFHIYSNRTNKAFATQSNFFSNLAPSLFVFSWSCEICAFLLLGFLPPDITFCSLTLAAFHSPWLCQVVVCSCHLADAPRLLPRWAGDREIEMLLQLLDTNVHR